VPNPCSCLPAELHTPTFDAALFSSPKATTLLSYICGDRTDFALALFVTNCIIQSILHGVDGLLTPAAAPTSAAKRNTPAGRRILLGRALQQDWVGTQYPAYNQAALGYYQG
jgi:hypothetical protein